MKREEIVTSVSTYDLQINHKGNQINLDFPAGRELKVFSSVSATALRLLLLGTRPTELPT